MEGKWRPRSERASDIVRLASDAAHAPVVISAVARRELEDLAGNIASFLAHTSELTATATQVEHLIATAEKRAEGGFIQWLKVLFGAPSREQCLDEAVSLLDSVRLRMDSLALLSTDVRQGIEDTQTWVDALQDSIPALPAGEAQDSARARVTDLKAMVANGHNTFSPYADLAEKSETLQGWALRAQRSLEA